MTMGERIQVILRERNMKQVDFARTLGISANYVSLMANGRKKGMSATLAKLIEETYGYSASWVLSGTGEKLAAGSLSASKAEILKKIHRMNDGEIRATLVFVQTLESITKQYHDGW